MRDDTTFLIGGNDQGRQAGGTALVLKRRNFILERFHRPSRDIVPGDVDAGNQALLGKSGNLRE